MPSPSTPTPPEPSPRQQIVLSALHDRLVEQVRALKGGRRLLEIGCGSGDLTLRLAEARPDLEIVAIDPSTDLLRKGRLRCADLNMEDRVRFDRADLSTLPLPDGAASVVVGASALGTSANPRVLLSEIARVLAPGGIAILVEDAPEGRSSAVRSGALLPSLYRPASDEDSLRDLIRRSPLRDKARFTRLPVSSDDTYLEIVLSKGAPEGVKPQRPDSAAAGDHRPPRAP